MAPVAPVAPVPPQAPRTRTLPTQPQLQVQTSHLTQARAVARLAVTAPFPPTVPTHPDSHLGGGTAEPVGGQGPQHEASALPLPVAGPAGGVLGYLTINGNSSVRIVTPDGGAELSDFCSLESEFRSWSRARPWEEDTKRPAPPRAVTELKVICSQPRSPPMWHLLPPVLPARDAPGRGGRAGSPLPAPPPPSAPSPRGS